MMTRKQRSNDVLEICISLIFSGHETVDSALAQYPEYADELKPKLEAALWIHDRQSVVDPRPGFISASRKRLVNQIQQEEKNPSSKLLFPSLDRSVLRLAFVTLFIFVSLLSIQGGFQAVNATLPGDSLYRWKLALEDIKLSTAPDAASEAELRIQLANERAREIEALLEQGNYDAVPSTLAQYRENLAIASDLIASLHENPVREALLAQTLTATITQHNQVFSSFAAAGIPDNIVATVNITVITNDEVTSAMLVVLEDLGEEGLPPGTLSTPGATVASGKSDLTPTLEPTELSGPTATSKSDTGSKPTNTPKPTNTTKPTNTPKSTNTPKPTNTKKPTNTDKPTDPPKPTKTDKPTDPPKPTKTDKPTKTPKK